MHQNSISAGAPPQTPLLAGFKGPTSKRRGGERRTREGRGRGGREREGREREKGEKG